jgi:hypothetical protein
VADHCRPEAVVDRRCATDTDTSPGATIYSHLWIYLRREEWKAE